MCCCLLSELVLRVFTFFALDHQIGNFNARSNSVGTVLSARSSSLATLKGNGRLFAKLESHLSLMLGFQEEMNRAKANVFRVHCFNLSFAVAAVAVAAVAVVAVAAAVAAVLKLVTIAYPCHISAPSTQNCSKFFSSIFDVHPDFAS